MRVAFATDLSEAIEAAIGWSICVERLGRYGIDEIHPITVTSPNVTSGLPGDVASDRTTRDLGRQRRRLGADGNVPLVPPEGR